MGLPDVRGLRKREERRNIKARKENLGNVPHLPKKKGKKEQTEEWLSNVVIRPVRPKN